MAEHLEKEIKTAYENNDQPRAAKKVVEYLEIVNNYPVNIAITGETGSGKSTLVNALRGISEDADGAAPTGVVETTMEKTEYVNPDYPNIKIWDLPGIGSTKFTADKYLKSMGFEKFDFFIIVSSNRFRENDAKLAKKIQKMKKKFYFVRSKIDQDIRNKRECERVLNLVRNNCTEELQELGCDSPKVFLVSGLKLNLYEFKDLWETLKEELPEHQRDALLLFLPNISPEMIRQKGKALENKIKWYTLASTAVAAVPVPGLSEAVDVGIIVSFIVHCVVSLGLTPDSLKKLSEVSGVPLEDLKEKLKSPFSAVEITPDLVMKVLTRSTLFITSMAIEEGLRFIPFIGIPFAMAVSGVTTYKVLKFILKILVEDAINIYNAA